MSVHKNEKNNTWYVMIRYAHMFPSQQTEMVNQLDEEMAEIEKEEKRNVS